MKTIFEDVNGLAGELQRLDALKFEAVEKKQLTEMLNRARRAGGTPVDTRELLLSSHVDFGDKTMGYTKEYAPHVEYGHRLVRNGKQVGYVPGQHYLLANVTAQGATFKTDLIKAIRGK